VLGAEGSGIDDADSGWIRLRLDHPPDGAFRPQVIMDGLSQGSSCLLMGQLFWTARWADAR